MVRQMRDMAMNDAEEEIKRAGEEVVALKEEIEEFIHNPFDAVLPAVAPLLGAVARGLGKNKD